MKGTNTIQQHIREKKLEKTPKVRWITIKKMSMAKHWVSCLETTSK